MKKIFLPALLCIAAITTQAQDAKMNTFINNLMAKMTVDEKIGQLNLVIPGGSAVTGSVVSTDVDGKIRKGQVGGLFGITGPDKVRQAQKIAVEGSRLHIPLMFGLDVIHGHKTMFPIPLGLSCSWDTALIRWSASIARKKLRLTGLIGPLALWWILPAMRAGAGFRKGMAKTRFWVRRLPGRW